MLQLILMVTVQNLPMLKTILLPSQRNTSNNNLNNKSHGNNNRRGPRGGRGRVLLSKKMIAD